MNIWPFRENTEQKTSEWEYAGLCLESRPDAQQLLALEAVSDSPHRLNTIGADPLS